MTERRQIRFLTSALMILGIVVGAATWVLPVVAAQIGGISMIFAAPLIAIPLLLMYPVYSTLSKIWPTRAGHYYYASRLVLPENKIASQFVGWIFTWTILSLNIAIGLQLMVVPPANFLQSLVPTVPLEAFRIILILVSLAMVRFGIRIVGWVESALTVGLLLSLMVLIVGGIFNFQMFPTPDPAELQISQLGTGFLLMFAGLLPALYIIDFGKEIENAKTNISRIFLIGGLANVVLIAVLMVVIIGVTGGNNLQGKTLHYVATQIGSDTVVLISGLGGFLAAVTTSIGIITVVTRWGYALIEDGIFPSILGKQNKYGEPGYFLLLMGVVAIPMIFAGIDVSGLAQSGVIAGLSMALPITIVGIRLPSTYPEVFQNNLIRKSHVLRPRVVQLASLLAALFIVTLGAVLIIQNPLSGMLYGASILSGVLIYAIRLWQGVGMADDLEVDAIELSD